MWAILYEVPGVYQVTGTVGLKRLCSMIPAGTWIFLVQVPGRLVVPCMIPDTAVLLHIQKLQVPWYSMGTMRTYCPHASTNQKSSAFPLRRMSVPYCKSIVNCASNCSLYKCGNSRPAYHFGPWMIALDIVQAKLPLVVQI